MDIGHQREKTTRIEMLYRAFLGNPVMAVLIGLVAFILISVIGALLISRMIIPPY